MTTHAELLPRYLQLREVSSKLHSRLMEALPKDAYNKGGKALGILQGGVLVFDSEHEMVVLADYCIHDIRENGINTVERYFETTPPPADSDEMVVLQACRKARYSLFAVEFLEAKVGVGLRDLFTNEPLFLMDVALSQHGIVGLVMAMRVFVAEGMGMSTGATLPFGVLSTGFRAEFVADIRKMFPRIDFANISPEEMGEVAGSLIRVALKTGAGERIATRAPGELSKGRAPERLPPRSQPIRRLDAHPVAPRLGRNDPCPCGSGKKFKRCCGRNA